MGNKIILYHIPHPSCTGAERWIYEGWRDAFIDLGHEFHEFTAFEDLKSKAYSIRPHIFMTAVNIINFKEERETLKKMRRNGTKVFMWIHWPLVPSCKNAESYILNDDLVDVYYGEREPEGMPNFEQEVKKPYYVIPNAANKKLHFPTVYNKKYDYDLVYLGAKLPMKQWFIRNVLLPVSKKYRVGIFGPYWTLKDNIFRCAVRVLKKAKFESGISYINKLRIQVPAQEENQLYSSAKIALNFHEREPDGTQSHIIVNQRTYKISACGGFQICDAVPSIRKYFNSDELIMANLKSQEWFDLIEYYIHNDKEREQIRNNGTRKVLSQHTYHNRVQQVIELYSQSE